MQCPAGGQVDDIVPFPTEAKEDSCRTAFPSRERKNHDIKMSRVVARSSPSVWLSFLFIIFLSYDIPEEIKYISRICMSSLKAKGRGRDPQTQTFKQRTLFPNLLHVPWQVVDVQYVQTPTTL